MAETEAQATGLADDSPPASSFAVTAKSKSVKPSLADVLAKQSRGGLLTPQERGVLGASKRKAKAKVMPAEKTENLFIEPPPANQSAPPPASPAAAASASVADNPFIEAETVAAAPAAAVCYSEPDAKAYKLAAEAICDAMDNGTQMWIGYEAEQAGADKQTVAQYESAVALKARNRELMVENSEPVIRFLCKWFKCEPEKLPEIIRQSHFAAGLIAHSFSVVAAVKSIRQSKIEKQQDDQPKA